MLCARITILIYTMPKAHNLLFVSKLALDIWFCLVKCSNFTQHLHNRFISSTMKRALKRSNGRSNTGINIGQRCNGNTCRERRSVQLVIRMQHKRLIQSANSYWVRFFAGKHVEEIIGQGDFRKRRDRLLTFSYTSISSNKRCKLCLKLNSLLLIACP
ncbi:hypothetical protein D3C78_1402830 [compost metagenome]